MRLNCNYKKMSDEEYEWVRPRRGHEDDQQSYDEEYERIGPRRGHENDQQSSHREINPWWQHYGHYGYEDRLRRTSPQSKRHRIEGARYQW